MLQFWHLIEELIIVISLDKPTKILVNIIKLFRIIIQFHLGRYALYFEMFYGGFSNQLNSDNESVKLNFLIINVLCCLVPFDVAFVLCIYQDGNRYLVTSEIFVENR